MRGQIFIRRNRHKKNLQKALSQKLGWDYPQEADIFLETDLPEKTETYVEVSSGKIDFNLFNDNYRDIQGNENLFFNTESTKLYGPDILYVTS